MARAAGASARAASPARAPRRGAAKPRPARPRWRSGPAPTTREGAASAALPARALGTPFARAARARTSSLLDALLAGRGWIALVGLLLAGIVFFNVDLLRMNRDIARTAERAAVLGRENARLRRDVAELASSERIQERAGALGLLLPAPGDVRYLRAHPKQDPRRAAKRITEPTLAQAPATAEPTVTAEPMATAEPTVTAEPTATTEPMATTVPEAATVGAAVPQATPTTGLPAE